MYTFFVEYNNCPKNFEGKYYIFVFVLLYVLYQLYKIFNYTECSNKQCSNKEYSNKQLHRMFFKTKLFL